MRGAARAAFVKLLRTNAAISSAFIESLAGSDGGARIPITTGLAQMEQAVTLTCYPDFGVRAALFTALGHFEVVEWVATSAATWREATETACRCIGVLNKAAKLLPRSYLARKAHLMLGSSVLLPRVGNRL